MKTGHKLSLIYSGITIGLILIAGLVFYFFTSNYIRNLYFHYMQEKRTQWRRRNSRRTNSTVKYRNVVIRRKTSIPTSKELFVNLENRDLARQVLSTYLDDEQIGHLYANQTVNFEHGQEVGTALRLLR